MLSRSSDFRFLRNAHDFLCGEALREAFPTECSGEDRAPWAALRDRFYERIPTFITADAASTARDWCEPILFPWLGFDPEALRALTDAGTDVPCFAVLAGEMEDCPPAGLLWVVPWSVPDLDTTVPCRAVVARPLAAVAADEMEWRRVDWGIITNGRRMRLFHRSSARSARAYLEADLEAMIGASDPAEAGEGARQIRSLFGRSAFTSGTDRRSLLDRIWDAGASRRLRTFQRLRRDAGRAVAQLSAIWLARGSAATEVERLATRCVVLVLALRFARGRSVFEASSASATPPSARTADGTATFTRWDALLAVVEREARDGVPLPDFTLLRSAPRLEDREFERVFGRLIGGNAGTISSGDLTARTLGDLYESLLSRGQGMEVDGSNEAETRPKRSGARRMAGAYYTPASIVREVVSRAIEPLFDGPMGARSAACEVRLLDPAMGCGHFLLEALEQMTCVQVEAVASADPAIGYFMPVERSEARRRIAEDCLYGVDTDDTAVRLAQLLIGLDVEPAHPDWEKIRRHLRIGDALSGAASGQRDDSRTGQAWQSQSPSEATEDADRSRPAPFHWEDEFPEVLGPGVDTNASAMRGFTCVLGNPPYVSLYSRESQRAGREPSFLQYAACVFGEIAGHPALSGRVNDFLLFLVRAVQLTAPGGRGGLVLPDTILTNESYAAVRRALTATGRLRAAVRLRRATFPGAGVGNALLFWSGSDASDGYVEISDWDGTAAGDGWNRLVAERASLLNRSGCPWIPAAEARRDGTVPLQEIAWVKDGINPGTRASRSLLLVSCPDGDPSLRPCLEGRSIEPFRIRPAALWVRYDPSILDESARKAGASLREAWIFDSPRIVYRQTAPYLIAAVEKSGSCTTNSVHNVILKSPDETVLYALCGYLNSRRCREEYQAATGETRRLFPQVHISAVRQLPIPRELLDRNSTCTRELAKLSKQLSLPVEICDREYEAQRQRIDALVEEMTPTN